MIKEKIIENITKDMSSRMSIYQINKLKEVLLENFKNVNISLKNDKEVENNNYKYLELFLYSKEIEGCSKRTIKYYKDIINRFLSSNKKNLSYIDTSDIREYLFKYRKDAKCSSITIDNVRRIFSSFFSWLEDEDYIVKSPVRRIHKIKTSQVIKDTYTEEDLEKMRDVCENIRDLTIIEILSSTGIRVGELVNLNKEDINLKERTGIVLGKGNKQREIYFDAKTKLHLEKYLNSRKDGNSALFVSKNKPNQRLSISGIELIIRKIGKKANLINVYPHKFRRTLATKAIDKGMPIEQVQKLLGHVKIDTTMQYAMVNQNNVKNSHRKYIS